MNDSEPPGPIADGQMTLGRKAESLFKQARQLADENISGLLVTLEELIQQANDIAAGGDLYPAGVRDVCKKFAEQATYRVQAISAITQSDHSQSNVSLEDRDLSVEFSARPAAQLAGEQLTQASTRSLNLEPTELDVAASDGGPGLTDHSAAAGSSWRQTASLREDDLEVELRARPREVESSSFGNVGGAMDAAPTTATWTPSLRTVPWVWKTPKRGKTTRFLAGRQQGDVPAPAPLQPK